MGANRDFAQTAESVTEGHPDKCADQTSDAIVDAFLAADPHARVACETLYTDGLAVLAGEITATHRVDFEALVRTTLRGIGYRSQADGIDPNECKVIVAVQTQSPDCSKMIDLGVAGDQGIMVGYATDETPTMMPAPIYYAHRLAARLAEVRRTGAIPRLRPDGKTQVTVEYRDGKPQRISSVVVSPQHEPEVDENTLRHAIVEQVIAPVLPAALVGPDTRHFINELGKFTVGGPAGDTGVTGRKVAADCYGPAVPHGGGAFSGKDPTKIDRSATYMARYIAKNLVAAGLATRCLTELAYARGEGPPVSIQVRTFGTGTVPEARLVELVRRELDLRMPAIIERLDLRKPIYMKTAIYGHFGREEPQFTWENRDLARAWKAAA